jgi:hypothetical protein
MGVGECGGVDVLGNVRVERQPDDPRLHGIEDCGDDGHGEEVRNEFLFDAGGQPRTDDQMSFTVDGRKRPAKDLAIYEVCPEATTRGDRRVYRADIIGIRHPDAELIVNAPTDISHLLDTVTKLRAENAGLSEIVELADAYMRHSCADTRTPLGQALVKRRIAQMDVEPCQERCGA